VAARLTLALSGLLPSLIFIPFFRGRFTTWLAGLALAGLVCLSTESGLQMEGALLFWLAFTLLTSLGVLSPSPPSLRRLGLLVGLAILTRPEYGVAALLVAAVYVGARRGVRATVVLLGPVLAIGAAWVIVATLLGVYPVPSTYLTKLVTAQRGMFGGGTFWDSFPHNLRAAFFGGVDVPNWLMGTSVAVVVAAVLWSDRRFWWALFFMGVVSVIELEAPGNYLWYHENFFIAFVVICGSALVFNSKRVPRTSASVKAVLTAVPLLAFALSGLGRNRAMSWNFERTPSRVSAYRMVAECSTGRGTFSFPQVEECLVAMNEIGIAAYFGGPRMWLLDASGLAQPASLPGASDHWLSWCYPSGVLRSFEQEIGVVAANCGWESRAKKTCFASAMTSERRASLYCDYYFPREGLCLEQLDGAADLP
jgi:hypothetical protein